MLPKGFVSSEDVRGNVIQYFSSFDESIQDFAVEEIRQEEGKEQKKNYKIDTFHKMVGGGKAASIPLKQESDGTLKMFALYPSLKEVLEHGALLFVDELNARSHPLLVRNIILTFLSPEINTRNAQLVFTTHDVWQLSNELLRRDEALAKKYMTGNYGAIPALKPMKMLRGRNGGWQIGEENPVTAGQEKEKTGINVWVQEFQNWAIT